MIKLIRFIVALLLLPLLAFTPVWFVCDIAGKTTHTADVLAEWFRMLTFKNRELYFLW